MFAFFVNKKKIVLAEIAWLSLFLSVTFY